jgi:hypothetical protein
LPRRDVVSPANASYDERPLLCKAVISDEAPLLLLTGSDGGFAAEGSPSTGCLTSALGVRPATWETSWIKHATHRISKRDQQRLAEGRSAIFVGAVANASRHIVGPNTRFTISCFMLTISRLPELLGRSFPSSRSRGHLGALATSPNSCLLRAPGKSASSARIERR